MANESALDAVLDKSGPQQVDYLEQGALKSEAIIGKNSLQNGLISSLLVNREGEISGVVRDMEVSDHPYQMDIPSTAANERPMARKKVGNSSPAGLHVVLDLPERVDYLTGDYSARSIANFMLALSCRIADETGSPVFVHSIVENESKTLFEGYIDEIYLAYRSLRGERKVRGKSEEPNLSGLLKLVNSQVDDESDAVMIVSDFQDGFDLETKTFDWEKYLKSTAYRLDDRMWTTRLTSLAHSRLPHGIIEGMDELTLESINKHYSATAQTKKDIINGITKKNLPHSVDVDLHRDNNEKHPVRLMTSYILGNQ